MGEAHSKNISIFGPGGLNVYLRHHALTDFKPIYGRYAIVQKIGDKVRIYTDHFGLYRLYIYRSDNNWAISESVEELVNFAHQNHLPTTPYVASAYAFMLQKGVGQQLSSFRTPVAEIELIPHWHDVQIEKSRLSFKRQEDVDWTTDLHQTNYNSSRFFVSLLTSYIEYGMNPFIRLSAGMDSRLTLAAMLSGADHSNLKAVGLQTSGAARHEHERRIVMDLLPRLPFYMAKKIPVIEEPSQSDWSRLYVGTQTQILSYPTYSAPFPVYTGACGELAREFYTWGGSLNGIQMHPYIPDSARETILQDIALSVSGFESQCKDSLTIENMHYQMFRNRFHFGRSPSETIMNYPPVIYALLSNGTGRGNNEPLHRQLFEMGGREILDHPFDEARKGRSGPAPRDWTSVKISKSEMYDREIFIDGLDAGQIFSNEERAARAKYGFKADQRLFSESFLVASDVAISLVERKGLLSPKMMAVARKELQMLLRPDEVSPPFLFPALMATLALNLSASQS